MQTKTWGKGVILFYLVFACCLMLLPSQAAFAAGDSVSVTFPVTQTFRSTTTGVDSRFTYTLTALASGNPMPAGSISGVYTFTIDGTSTKGIGPIVYTATGVYHYRIAIDASKKATGYTYDSQVYTLSVYVKSAGNHLVTEAIAKKDAYQKVDTIGFVNTYAATATQPDPDALPDPEPDPDLDPEPDLDPDPIPDTDPDLDPDPDLVPMADLPVRKTVSGNPSTDSRFTFTLTAQKASFPMPQGSANGEKSITIWGSGEGYFGTWQYTEAGTYFYTIAEENTGEADYTYDTTVYTITDVVRDVDGQLVLDRVVTNTANKPVSAYTFINRYSSGGIVGPIVTPKTGDDAIHTPYVVAIGISTLVAMGCIYGLGKRNKNASPLQTPEAV